VCVCVLIFDDYINIKHTQGKAELFITERGRKRERKRDRPKKATQEEP